MYLMSFLLGLALGLKGSAHGLAIGISCTQVIIKKNRKTFTPSTSIENFLLIGYRFELLIICGYNKLMLSIKDMADRLASGAFLGYHPTHICKSEFVGYINSHKELFGEYLRYTVLHNSGRPARKSYSTTTGCRAKDCCQVYNRGLHNLHHHPHHQRTNLRTRRYVNTNMHVQYRSNLRSCAYAVGRQWYGVG